MKSVRRAVEQEHGTLFSSAYEKLVVSGSDDCQESPPRHGQFVRVRFVMIVAELSAQCTGLITHV